VQAGFSGGMAQPCYAMYDHGTIPNSGQWKPLGCHHNTIRTKAKGFPFSPYLFLLCAEGFLVFLNRAEVKGELEGIWLCNNAPSFNHLLFENDSMDGAYQS
jgi:hypothetical protein